MDQIGFAHRVPDGAISLAWITLPEIRAEAHLSLIDSGQFIAENTDLAWDQPLGEAVDGDAGGGYVTTYNPDPGGSSGDGLTPYAITRGKSAAESLAQFVLEQYSSQIRVEPPKESPSGVWCPRVQDGRMLRRYVMPDLIDEVSPDNSWLSQVYDPGDELVLIYTIPEMERIPYLPTAEGRDMRLLSATGVTAEIVDTRIVQIPAEDLYTITSLTVNGEEILASSLTRGGALPGGVTGWDPDRGTVTLTRALTSTDLVQADFLWSEYLYTFRGYNDDEGDYHDLDLNPQPGHTYDGGNPSSGLLNRPVYLFLIPSAAYRVRKANGDIEQKQEIYSGLRWTDSFLRWSLYEVGRGSSQPAGFTPFNELNTFGHGRFDRATFVSHVATPGRTEGSGSATTSYPSAVVLARMYPTPSLAIGQAEVVDTRVRGGGIPRHLAADDPRLPGETQRAVASFLDESSWDGQAVPLGGVLLVQLPKEILTGEGGFEQFTPEEVEAIVQQHVAAGVRVLINYV